MEHTWSPGSGVVVARTTAGDGDAGRGVTADVTTGRGARGRYVVTYDFGGEAQPPTASAVLATVGAAAARLRERGASVEPQGATAELDAASGLRSLTVRYDAASEGLVGWLNCLARLPASGRPRSDP